MNFRGTRLVRRLALSLLLVVNLAHATGAPVDRATPEQKRLAQKTFEAADELYEAGRFEEAVSAFRGSYEIVASPNSLLMIARSERELGHLAEAYELFERSLALAESGAGRYAETARATREELDALRNLLGFIVFDVSQLPEGATLRLGERSLAESALAHPVAVLPGSVSVELKTNDGKVSQQQLSITRGATVRFNAPAAGSAGLSPASPTPTRPPAAATEEPAQLASATPKLRSAAFVALGVGAAGAIAFGVFGALDHAAFQDLKDHCPDANCAADQQATIDRGRRYQLFANVGLGVALVGVATGATLYVLSLDQKRTVAASFGPRSVVIEGHF